MTISHRSSHGYKKVSIHNLARINLHTSDVTLHVALHREDIEFTYEFFQFHCLSVLLVPHLSLLERQSQHHSLSLHHLAAT